MLCESATHTLPTSSDISTNCSSKSSIFSRFCSATTPRPRPRPRPPDHPQDHPRRRPPASRRRSSVPRQRRRRRRRREVAHSDSGSSRSARCRRCWNDAQPRSCANADGPRDAPCPSASCQLYRNKSCNKFATNRSNGLADVEVFVI